MLTNREFHLQTGNLAYKTGFSFTKRESWVTKGILGLLFTKDSKKDNKKDEETVREKLKKCKHILVPINSNTNMVKIVYIDIYGNEFMETKILEE